MIHFFVSVSPASYRLFSAASRPSSSLPDAFAPSPVTIPTELGFRPCDLGLRVDGMSG